MGCWASVVGRARLFLSTLVLTFVLGSSMPAAGAPAPGFPLTSSQPSPVTGAVTISAPAVRPEAGLVGVQFKVDGYVLNALDTTSPFQVIWSAASASNGNHTLTAEARLTSGVVIQSAPLVLTVANPTTFNRLFHVDAGAGNDGSNGLTASTAWRTLDRANSAVTAGDTVLLRGTFSGQFIQPNASGTAAQPIRFMSDPGQLAVLDNSGIRLTGRQFVVVEDVLIRNYPGQAAVIEDSNFNAIRGSQFLNIGNGSGAWGHAIRITRSSDNVVEQNRITNIGNESENTGDSIYIVSGAHRNRILGNTLQNGGHSLIQIRESDGRSVRDNLIANNIFFRNNGFQQSGQFYTITITHYGNPTSWPVGSLNGNRIQNNIVLRQPGSAGEVTVLRIRDGSQGGNLSYTLAAFEQTYATASGNLQVDPMFTDEANRVFTLRSGSPAIDRGLAIAGVAYLGAAPDLGAHEYEGSAPPADTTPPTVALTAPTLGQTVSGMVTLRATASDNVGMTRIDYLQDGQVLGMLSPAAMTFAWNTAAVSNGAHTLTARAYDAAGNATTSTGINVTVANADTTAPTVAITTPTASPTYTASSTALTLGGTAADNVGVTQVTWANSRGGNGTATGTTSWTASGIVLQTGANALTVTARDAAGNIATRTVTVTYADTTAPTVAITTPTTSPTYTASSSALALGGTASAATQVTWANDRGGTGTATGTTSWTAGGIVLQAGANLLTVTARDAAGTIATRTVTVTYAAATVPTVTVTTPTASPTYSTNISSLTLRGTASGATQVTLASYRAGNGIATGSADGTGSSPGLQPGL